MAHLVYEFFCEKCGIQNIFCLLVFDYGVYNLVCFSLCQCQEAFCQMWNSTSMQDLELKGEDPVYVCETVEVCQKENSGHDVPLRVKLVAFQKMNHCLLRGQLTNARKRTHMMLILTTDDELSYTERLIRVN